MDIDSSSQNEFAGRSEEFQAVVSEVQQFFHAPPKVCNPQELSDLEHKVENLTKKLAGLVTGEVIQASLGDEEMRSDALKFVKSLPHPMRHDGVEKVRVLTKSGQEITVLAPYFRRKGKRRFKRRHPGVYPGLVLLGIYGRCSPTLLSEVSLFVAALPSLEEARNILFGMGINLDIKTIRTIAYRFSRTARFIQQETVVPLEDISGRRVVVSCDGGRVRIRTTKRGPKTKKKRNRYKTEWREPKLLIIYVVDANGRKEQTFLPVIDGTMQGPDALFTLLGRYLEQLNIGQADQILFVADGAPWIWNRIELLIAHLDLRPEQCLELIDFYHAVEHLGKVAALQTKWDTNERKRWIKQQRKLLLTGKVEQVIDAVRTICRGRNSKEIQSHRNYFVKNSGRMMYAKVKALKMPIGSGAVESAIRRVINMRLKGAGIFWREENAEATLMLRSYYKSGRWNMLKNMAIPNLFALAW